MDKKNEEFIKNRLSRHYQKTKDTYDSVHSQPISFRKIVTGNRHQLAEEKTINDLKEELNKFAHSWSKSWKKYKFVKEREQKNRRSYLINDIASAIERSEMDANEVSFYIKQILNVVEQKKMPRFYVEDFECLLPEEKSLEDKPE